MQPAGDRDPLAPHSLSATELKQLLERLSECLRSLKLLEADQTTTDREQRLVDVGAALVADAQAAVLV